MKQLGKIDANGTVQIPWRTQRGGADVTAATARIYRSGSTTQRTSSSGITLTEDFDGIAGAHIVTIDLSDDADPSFYASGQTYHVMLVGATIDGETVNAWLATFTVSATDVVDAPPVDIPDASEGLIEVGWHDQPDYYNTALMSRFWDTVHADARVVASKGYGSQRAWTGASEAASIIKYFTLDENKNFGFGYRLLVEDYPSAEKILLAAVEEDGTVQLCVSIGTDGTLAVWRGNLTTMLGDRSTDAVSAFSSLKFGFRGRVDRTDGFAEVFVNGNSVIRVDEVNTAATDPAEWHGLYVGLAPDIYQSHAYMGTGDGALRPGYLVKVLRPASIHTNEWSANTGTIDDAMDEADADDDTTYAFSTAFGQRFAVTLDTMLDTPIIYGTRSVFLVRNLADSGSPSFASLIRDEDGRRDTSHWKSCTSDAWRAIDRFDRLNPFTGLPWTVGDINACGWGGETLT
jgi:hypothetical protein